MNRIILLFFIIVLKVQAQDTLCFKNGEKKAVKVLEIGLNEVKYSRLDNLTGPTYIIYKSELKSISYSNGSVDKFGDSNNANPAVSQAPSSQLKSAIPAYIPQDKIIMSKSRMYYHGKWLSEHRFEKMINGFAEGDKQARLKESFELVKLYKRKQHGFNTMGLVVGLGAPFIGLIATAITESAAPFLVGASVGIGVGITSGVLMAKNKRLRLEKLGETVKIFNGDN